MVFYSYHIMKTDFIPFQIGMQYENWEFDLEPISSSRTYDKYQYIKNDITILFDIEIQHIYLYFNLDILNLVEIVFIDNSKVIKFIILST